MKKNVSLYTKFFIVSVGIIILFFTSACKEEPDNIQATNDAAYPSPNDKGILPGEPNQNPDTQDSSQNISSNSFGTVLFKLDPVYAGDMSVSGEGPVGIILQVMDITFIEILGSGVIQEDNHFKINLANPITAGHLIGIQLGTQKDPETWLDLWDLKGERARSIPNIGYFFDSQIPQPRE